SLRSKRDSYGGFNVLLYDGEDMHHYNNIYDEHHIVDSGIHGVSNATLNTPWPKVNTAKSVLENTVDKETIEMNTLISLLANDEIAQDEVLPNTGVGIHLRSEEQTSELQSREKLVCRLLLEIKRST